MGESDEKKALGAAGQKDDLGLEELSDAHRKDLLSQVAEALAQVISGEKSQSEEAPKDPRILRLLERINPQVYADLKKELGAILTLIASPTTGDAVRAALKAQMESTIAQRLGPSFSEIALAEGLLGQQPRNFYLRALGAAIPEVPNVIESVQDPELGAVDAVQAIVSLDVLKNVSAAASYQIRERLVKFFLDRIGSGKNIYFIRNPEKSEHSTWDLSASEAILPEFEQEFRAECNRLGIEASLSTRKIDGHTSDRVLRRGDFVVWLKFKGTKGREGLVKT